MIEGAEAKRRARELWGARPAGADFAEGLAPGSREYFEAVLAKRSTWEQPWLFELVPFREFAGRRILEIGCGAGYDAYEIVRNGGRYVGIDIANENPNRTRAHLAFYDLRAELAVADAELLPFRTESIEVAFSNGVLHHVPDFSAALREIARVLRPGGSFWIIVYHKNSILYRVSLFLVEHILRGGFRQRTFEERLSMIENWRPELKTARPLVTAYTRRELVHLLETSGFAVRSTMVRKLVREDLPDIGWFSRIWKLLPDRWLSTIGKAFGWYVVARAEKKQGFSQ